MSPASQSNADGRNARGEDWESAAREAGAPEELGRDCVCSDAHCHCAGTDITFHIEDIRGSSQGPEGGKGFPPGLAFKMGVDLTFLSQANSKACDGDKAYCCADGESWSVLEPQHGCSLYHGFLSSATCPMRS